MTGPTVLGVRGECLRLREQIGFSGTGQGDRLARTVSGVDEDQFAFYLASAGAKAGRVAIGRELQEVVGEAPDEELGFTWEFQADRFNFTDADLIGCLEPLVGATSDGDGPTEGANFASHGAFELPALTFGFGDLAHGLMPLAARFGTPRSSARTRAWTGSERREFLRAQLNALRLDINAHQGST